MLTQNRIDKHFCSSQIALKAITAAANHLADLPGRKNLVWFNQISGIGGTQNCAQPEHEAEQALNRANMTLYAIDSRGLESTQPDASIGAKQMDCERGCDDRGILVMSMAKQDLDGVNQSNAVMWEVAETTGGRAFQDNDILGALAAPFKDARAAYSLGFYPESPKLDGAYHQLTVKVPGRPELTVRFRRGYVDESSDPKSQLRTALWSPIDSRAIPITAELISTDTGKFEVKMTIGVTGANPDSQLHVILAQKDSSGREYDYRDDTLKLALKPGTEAVAYRQFLEPNPKAISVRVIVRDETGNLGSLTIPIAKN